MPHVIFLFDATRWSDWNRWLNDHGWNLLTVLIVVGVANLLFRRVASRVFRIAIERASTRGSGDDPVGIARRADTISAVLNWFFGIVLVVVGGTLLLDEVGVNVTALVAGVGVVGIAIGLGAQALVRDVINGMFILIEDQYRVGDVVQVANVTGTVTEINPRRTVLRDADGNVHSVSNGTITVATNMTQGYSAINLDVPVTYDTDIAQAMALLREVCQELTDERGDDILTPLAPLRVQATLENWLLIKITGNVRAGKQWDLTGELRARIKQRFDANAITMTPAARWRPEEAEPAPKP